MVKVVNHFKVGIVITVYCGFKKLSDSIKLIPLEIKPNI